MRSEVWEERFDSSDEKREADVRSEWARDYGRLIHSAAFRRLQSKTQVLGLGESDFYRTRLTHSMEVSQVGVGIIRYLKDQDANSKYEDIYPNTALMSTICLAHDLGHPPFGHGGEIALNICMRDYGGFEGNAQTLRILSKLDKSTKEHGLNPTRRLLLGILKYPAPYSEVVNNNFYEELVSPKWLSLFDKQQPPKCYYDEEKELVKWILNPLYNNDKELFSKIERTEGKHGKTTYKSFDCSVMELADDISYSVHDLEDAISLKLVTKDEWVECFRGFDSYLKSIDDDLTNKLFSSYGYERKKIIGSFVNSLITNIEIKAVNENYQCKILKYNAVLKDEALEFQKRLGEFVFNKVIKSTNVQLLEFKGQRIVVELFEALSSDPGRLLPESTKRLYSDAGTYHQKKRVISDYISGMTDAYATKLYEKLYLPNRGSIFDEL